MFTHSLSLSPRFTHFCPFALFGSSLLPRLESDVSACLCPHSAPSGGSVASDAAGGGQPFVSLIGGDL